MDLDLIRKVQKLFRLARGTNNKHEAEAAAAAATKLVEQHRLKAADVENETGPCEHAVIEKEPIVEGARIDPWRRRLIAYIADAHACILVGGKYKEQHKGALRDISFLMLVGRPTDTAVVRETYAYLISELSRLYARDVRETDLLLRKSWWLGAAHGVYEALMAGKKQARQGATSTAIVLVDKRAEEASDLLKNAFPKMKSRKLRQMSAERSSYMQGMRAGASAMSTRRTQLEPAHPTADSHKGQLGLNLGSEYNPARRNP